jgi:hypothetical protein
MTPGLFRNKKILYFYSSLQHKKYLSDDNPLL